MPARAKWRDLLVSLAFDLEHVAMSAHVGHVRIVAECAEIARSAHELAVGQRLLGKVDYAMGEPQAAQLCDGFRAQPGPQVNAADGGAEAVLMDLNGERVGISSGNCAHRRSQLTCRTKSTATATTAPITRIVRNMPAPSSPSACG